MTWDRDRLEFRPAARILVQNGKPANAEGSALQRLYNARPPRASEKPVVVGGEAFGAVVRAKRERKEGV